MAARLDDRRFVAILNDAFSSSQLDLSAPPDPANPAYIAAWAGFVRACVARGVEVGDRRWERLTVHVEDGRGRFRLTDDSEPKETADEPDFGVGLALLMSLLGRNKDKG
ncbi:MAG TPA: hypothetical protein VFU38_07370 [Candidatus Krumholzibacteria bacterium]|nr:hypothetical protein [Candidatus Krumholzibacteria bacterium]